MDPVNVFKQQPAGDPRQLVVVGTAIQTVAGHPFVPRGFTWDRAWLPSDGELNASEGANHVRITFDWMANTDPHLPPYPPQSNQDGYDPNAPGNIAPSVLSDLQARVRLATESGLYAMIACRGQSDPFYQNPLYQEQIATMWGYLAHLFADNPLVGWFETLVEPSVLGDARGGELVQTIQRQVIKAIRASDAQRIVCVGPPHAYNIRSLALVLMPDIDQIVYTSNMYDLSDQATHHGDGDFVRQLLYGKKPLTGYPGPYFDYLGSKHPGLYPGAGTMVTLDKDFLRGLIGSAVTAAHKNNSPFYIDQCGIRSGTPNAIDWARDVIEICNDAGIGWSYWVYRSPFNPSSLLADDIGVWWQDSKGQWTLKADWIDMLSGLMSA